jgi:hypothetical protein
MGGLKEISDKTKYNEIGVNFFGKAHGPSISDPSAIGPKFDPSSNGIASFLPLIIIHVCVA